VSKIAMESLILNKRLDNVRAIAYTPARLRNSVDFDVHTIAKRHYIKRYVF